MVTPAMAGQHGAMRLSVLALSSRFDGLFLRICRVIPIHSFSTRSVESF